MRVFPECGGVKFSGTHMSSLGVNLNNQRKTGSRCDTTLICGDQKFKAHQNILCAASEYFTCLRDGGFSESRQEDINLTESISDPEIIELILEFIYTGTMNITSENFRELLDAASLLLLTGAQELLSEYLTNSLIIGNCLEIYTLAYRYSLKELSGLCLTIIKTRMHDYFIHGLKLLEIPSEVFTNLQRENVFVHCNRPDVSKAIDEYINSLDAGNEGRTKAAQIANIAGLYGIELNVNTQLKTMQNTESHSHLLSTKGKGNIKASSGKEEIVIFNYKENEYDLNTIEHKSIFYGWLSKYNRWIKIKSVDSVIPKNLSFIGIADSSMIFTCDVYDHAYDLRSRVISIQLSQDVMEYVQQPNLPKQLADKCKYFTAWNKLFCVIPVSEKIEVKCSMKAIWSRMRSGNEKTVHIDVIISYSIHCYSVLKKKWMTACDIDVSKNYYKDIGPTDWCADGRTSCCILPWMDMEVVNTGGTVYLTMVNSDFPNMGRTNSEEDFLTVFTLSQKSTKGLKCQMKFQINQEVSLDGTYKSASNGNVRIQSLGQESGKSKVQMVKEITELDLKRQTIKVSIVGN